MHVGSDVVITKNALQILQQKNIHYLILYVIQSIITNVCTQRYLGEKKMTI